MSTWRVEQHYGFGAARIPIQPEAHRVVRVGFGEGVTGLTADLFEGGPSAALRRIAGEGAAIVLALFIMSAFVITLMRDHSDLSPIDVVMLETIQTIPEPVIEEPPPLPLEPVEKVVPPPPAIPKPVVPRPPPPQLAERPKPPPPAPVTRPKPQPKSRPRPVMPQIARVVAPKPPPTPQLDRATRERPITTERPRIAVDLATPSVPTPAPTAMPERAFRVAVARPAPGEHARVMPGVAPAAPHIETPAPAPDLRRVRTSAPRPTSTPRGPTPKLSAAPLPAAPDPVTAPVVHRASRAVPVPTTRHAPPPTAEMARAPIVASVVAAPSGPIRSDRAVPTAPRGSQNDRPGVAGVPLGDLAACVSDREEDRLKQAVVAAVTTQEECVSSKGTYRFVQTKNLNAFLMWIDRSPARPVEDRCGELHYALECLESAGRRAAR